MTAQPYWPEEDLRGRKFGRLTVREFGGRNKDRRESWICDCECGRTGISVKSCNLKRKVRATASCGCLMRERTSEANRKSSWDNPVTARNYAYYRMYRSRKKQDGRIFEWEFGNDDRWLALVTSDCFYCGAKPTRPYIGNGIASKYGKFYCNGMDRYDNDKGYTFDNVVPCCRMCNEAKKAMHGDDFIAWIRRIAAIHGIGNT
jgi:hypothetical protein